MLKYSVIMLGTLNPSKEAGIAMGWTAPVRFLAAQDFSFLYNIRTNCGG
jgi:hypothetical protein